MAKITIAGEAVIITSALKLEDIKKVQKYRPKELVLKGGEDGKEADKLGAAMVNLKKLEEKLPAVLAEIDAEKAEIMANITIAQ
mgnify:CR=1 FL=1